MRLNLRIISPVLICALCAAPVGAQDLTGTLKNIRDTGIVKIGNRDASIPFSYYDDKQQPIGYGIDICLKVVDAIKAELKMPNLRIELCQ
jgi:glutamate/aspartate transport system substrate-binding protein